MGTDVADDFGGKANADVEGVLAPRMTLAALGAPWERSSKASACQSYVTGKNGIGWAAVESRERSEGVVDVER